MSWKIIEEARYYSICPTFVFKGVQNVMIRKLGPIVGAVIFAALPLTASATISPGTQLTGSIDQSLSSRDAHAGETFTLSRVLSSNHDINGAVVHGHVATVQRAGQGTPAKIELDFDTVNSPSGTVYKIVGHATKVEVKTENNAGREAAAGAGGALVGGLIGGGTGAVLGGGGGFLYAKNSRENVVIPHGSLVTVKVAKTLNQAR